MDNGLGLGEEAELDVIVFITVPNVQFITELAFLPNCCYAFVLLSRSLFVYPLSCRYALAW
jgi:hypothetical protein